MAENQPIAAASPPPHSTENGGAVESDQPMPEAEISPADSESDSDDEAEEALAKLEIETLESALANNPYDYNSHVQYISFLRKQGELEKLRQAREAMSELFPLSPEMWREWAQDEISVSSRAESYLAVEKLFERGVSDYLSVDLWCDYINFVQEHDTSVNEYSTSGISKARALFERAITASGLHVAEGGRIWELYRKFEQAILLNLQGNDNELREKQIQRIRSLFHRQLSVPLSDVKSTLIAYEAWETEQSTIGINSGDTGCLPSHVATAHKKALDVLSDRMHLEEQISKKDLAESEKLQQYMIYLKLEQSSKDPARVQILFERAITEFPIYSDLWLDYTRYLDRTFKASNIVRKAYQRATRNCPCTGELWVRYLLCLERGRASEGEISSVFEKSLDSRLCTFSSYYEYLDIFLTRVDGLRRRLSEAVKVEEQLDFSVVRDTFQRAVEYLSLPLKDTDELMRMYSYWAYLEFNLAKDPVAARGVWESLLKISGSMLDTWKGYIEMEIQMGHINEARSLYKRCYSKRFPGTGSEDICQTWMRFEKERGSLEDFDLAMQKVAPRLEELQLFKLQQEIKSMGSSTDKRGITVENMPREKRKPVSSITDEESPAKRRKDISQKPKENNKQNKKQARDSPGAVKLETHNGTQDQGNNVMQRLSNEKPKFFKDQCTAFLSNLSLKATDKDLLNFFSEIGGVIAIRILKDKFTQKSRGLAYVDFSDDAHLIAALAKNKHNLLEKRVV
ncbi:hypothetical protein Leryth_004260 [Lithospermum erythrorhizon]|nr:hypothetical protein Leryth_004260 [Lithospermum erythrorhizon]